MTLTKRKNLTKIAKFLAIITLVFASSCSSLSKSQILNTRKTEAISVLELKILFDGIEEKSNSGIFGECHLIFSDKNGRVKSSNSDDYSFYMIKTKPGIIKIDALKCSNWTWYYKNRYLDLSGLEFIAKSDHINYLGNLVINYEPRSFGFLDIFGLGGAVNDSKGAYDIKVYDNIERSINFLKEYYPELKYKNVLRSVIHQQKNNKAKLKDLQERDKFKNKTTDNYFKEIIAKPKNDQDKNPTNQPSNLVESIEKTDIKDSQNLKTNDFNAYKLKPENNIPVSNNIPTSNNSNATYNPENQFAVSPNQNLNSVPAPAPTQNISPQPVADPSPIQSATPIVPAIVIPSENNDEQVTRNSVNNEKKIGKIIKKNRSLQQGYQTQSSPANPDQNPKPQINDTQQNYRPRPAEVQ
ncbi:MAG: hypothetical protein RL769_170 [Pseudomonadota bacterium]|jgi:hypothetical protein